MSKENGKIRVALTPGERAGWLGGANYDRNLLRAIGADPETSLEPVLFGAADLRTRLPSGIPPVSVVCSDVLGRQTFPWAVRTIARRTLQRDPVFERVLRAREIAALSHSTQVWRSKHVAMLGWIADFQHCRLPQYFSVHERRQRDRVFRRICRKSTTVIVSSECAKRDLEQFEESAGSRARVLRFVAEPPSAEDVPERDELAAAYDLPQSYLFLPNQFWAHKNHLAVIDALAILRDRGERVVVIATGETYDHRRPEHFESLKRRVRELGVADLFRPLGVVPYPHVVGLMRHATAVVNPSEFEGWSTTVEEAKSLGKRVILSDIDVHREQDPPGASFFAPDRPDQLADVIAACVANEDEADDRLMAERARDALPARRIEFAQTYEAIIRDAIKQLGTHRPAR